MNIILLLYGLFLISCGIISVIFIGPKAKTALISGGTSGLVAILTGYFYSYQNSFLSIAAILIPFALFIVFAWRSTKTFLRLIELIWTKDANTNAKAIAFLIISLMAIVSIFTFAVQLTQYVNLLVL
ncbi:hypothetical protein [Cytophaga hutchinsonii]|uniref:Transmembrane protein n=1 Tax=Cytophaga hutchinsonii (strain ATCC 33406 / DSM 1761 / CIP 103989 / NBRC 15051 / NCIMB 9469 / D465) TaxID=269798 RepID=A0A6N4SN25_CYTH3|nr:hypothetical protein [Cytophaga hutchinsonii]ABG57688.1 conserved hypothetical protein [Cytophaga hutchinsonii ATCC 33406]SFX02977.1 hypothetical protein SAMN04487930_101248 [Cytophaga hutchinsonii ATCC 33406]